MAEKIYLATIALILVMQFFRPVYGIMGVIVIFMVKAWNIFPIHVDYHMSIIIVGLLMFSVFVRGISTIQLNIAGILLLIIGLCLLSNILNGITEGKTWLYLYELYKSMFFAIIILCAKFKKKEVYLIMLAFVAGSFANAVYAVIEQVQNAGAGLYRSVGFRGQPNGLATVLYMCIPLTYFFYTIVNKKLYRLIFVSVLIFQFLGIICSVSRSGLLGLLFVGGGIFVKNIKKLTTVILIGACFFFMSDMVKELYSQRNITQASLSKNSELNISVGSRVDALKDAFLLWLSSPLWGVGLGNFAGARQEEFGVSGIIGGMAVHNTLVQIIAETGLCGLLLFILLLKKAFNALSALKQQGDVFYQELARNMQLFVFALVFAMQFTNMLASEIFWMFITVPFIVQNAYLHERDIDTRA